MPTVSGMVDWLDFATLMRVGVLLHAARTAWRCRRRRAYLRRTFQLADR
jgi:hypothetical protein